ncbi:MAG: ABC transporter ATP-binding protein [Henriciella sp.]|nr:ABC transporter ATP-binding protein [Henriciella sp.]
MMTAVLELQNIVREYKSEAGVLKVLEGANLVLNPGELVGLVGPSGSGKSTLLHTAGLLEKPEGGQVFLEGEDCMALNDSGRTRLRREKLGFVYQFHHLLPEFNARDNVAMPLMVGGLPRRKAREKADALLAEMGLSERLKHQPGQMSGGEQQRVAIARALVNDPRLVIADEPTGNLDPATTERVFESLIRMARGEGAAVLVATHNMALTQHMDRVLTLQNGKLTDFQS